MRNNNQGFSLIIVIIIVVFGGILVSTVLSTTLFNYQMKVMNLQSKDNFYSAEIALDEIKMGLQQDISEALSTAYIKVAQQYYNISESKREEEFKTYYSSELEKRLQGVQRLGTNYYSIERLEQYLDKTVYSPETNTGAKLSSIHGILATTSQGVTLKNLQVTYTDSNQYTTQIQTDIVLGYPELDFTQSTTMPDLLQYTLIANQKLEALESMTTTIEGNVYAGEDGVEVGIGKLSLLSGSRMISKGAVEVGKGSTVVFDAKTTLWARDIEVKSAQIELKGTTYVADDLRIQDEDHVSSKVTISNEYYGFGNETSAMSAEALLHKKEEIINNPSEYSSAILVNGRNVTLDLSNVRRLLLGGNAYIGTTKAYMGESLTVKSNQLAYLVPGELIGIGSEYGGMNPTTKEYYDGLYTQYNGEVAEMVSMNEPIAKYGGNTLKQLGVSSVELYRMANGQAYFYMLFDSPEKASAFYENYYGSTANTTESKRLNEYLKLYVDQIKVSNNSQIKYMLNGTAITYQNEKVGELSNTLNDGNAAYIFEQEVGYQNSFAAYCSKLIPGYYSLTAEEKQQDVFENLVEEEKVIHELGQNRRTEFVEEGNGGVAIVVDNQGASSNPIKVSEVSSNEKGTVHIIIATGDVIVDESYSGLILAKGTVTLKNSVTITKNQEKVLQTLQAKNQEGQSVAQYLKNAHEYLISSNGDQEEALDTSTIELNQLIQYENWRKE